MRPPLVRQPTHAGSWYTDDASKLSSQLDGFLAAAEVDTSRARALIVPHAGYSYSGPTAAYGYKAFDPRTFTRVFLLGPSHHWFTRQCALSPAAAYRTPLGDISIDQQIYAELRVSSAPFVTATASVDEAEHSLEARSSPKHLQEQRYRSLTACTSAPQMHLPYLVKCFAGQPFKLVPIIVGALTPEAEEAYGRALADYIDDPRNLFVISSDFCHWGQRFGFTYHDTSAGPIHKSVEQLDRLGMRLIEGGDPAAFTAYLEQHGNTICGRHPIGVLMHAMKSCRTRFTTRFTRYAQSSRAVTASDSSVSYASAVCEAVEDAVPV